MSKYFQPIKIEQSELDDVANYKRRKLEIERFSDPDKSTEEERNLARLVYSIYYFDYYYNYSDDGNVWRNWESKHEEITRKINELDNEEHKLLLRKHFNLENRSKLTDHFDWLKCGEDGIPNLFILRNTGMTIETIERVRGLAKAIKDNFSGLSVHESYSVYSNRVCYANDMGKFLRQRGDKHPVITPPPAVYEAAKALCEAINDNDVSLEDLKLAEDLHINSKKPGISLKYEDVGLMISVGVYNILYNQ